MVEFVDPDLYLGCSLNVSHCAKDDRHFLGYYDTVVDNGLYAFQFQLGAMQTPQRKKVESAWLRAVREYEEYKVFAFSHAPYIHNLCGSTKEIAHDYEDVNEIDMTPLGVNEKGKPVYSTTQKHVTTVKSLAYELDVLSHFRGGVVVHPGSNPNTAEALKRVASAVNCIVTTDSSIERLPRKLLLENCAGEGTKLPKTFEEMQAIFSNLSEKAKEETKVCLDTCHTFASGLYDLSNEQSMDAMFKDFDRLVGPEYLDLIHLNDSQTEFDSHRDRHECLTYGHIWGESTRSLNTLLNICKQRKLPLVLETPNYKIDVALIRSI